MLSILVSALLVGVPFVAGAPRDELNVLARASLEDREDSCHADNLLRLLRTPTNLPEAVPFCSSYLHFPASTSVVSTMTPVVVSETTATVSITDTLTSSITNIDTTTSTETATVSEIHTITQRDVLRQRRPCSSRPLSESVLSTYDASQISSACACLTIPLSVTSTTATALTQTFVSSATVTVETTITAMETILTTFTEATTTTTSTTSTSTVLPPPVPTNFRLTGLDPTGAKLYLNQLKYGSLYDVLMPTTNITESLTFHLDATQRLWYNSTALGAPAFAFYSAPWAASNQKPGTASSANFAFQTDKWLAASTSPVYTGFTWSIDPYTLALTQTTFPATTLMLQSCKVNFSGTQRYIVLIGQALNSATSCTWISSLGVESVDN